MKLQKPRINENPYYKTKSEFEFLYLKTLIYSLTYWSDQSLPKLINPVINSLLFIVAIIYIVFYFHLPQLSTTTSINSLFLCKIFQKEITNPCFYRSPRMWKEINVIPSNFKYRNFSHFSDGFCTKKHEINTLSVRLPTRLEQNRLNRLID